VRRTAPWLVILAVLIVTAAGLHLQGRLWRCACGELRLWAGRAWGPDTSQHLFDPYSLTHVLHGFVLAGLLAYVAPRAPATWKLALAIGLESLWEMVENSAFVIERYRATAALGYTGDTIVNSLGDILACALGVVLARALGLRRALVAFALIEIVLLVWIKDSLLLNVTMLIHAIPPIKAWQLGR
jgi:Protein of unknown function (DUF2585)